jgi:predicted nucleotidyltransferase
MTELLTSPAFAGVLRRAARACEAALAAAGVRARVVGSLAYGGVRPGSDLDLLILAHRGSAARTAEGRTPCRRHREPA